MDRRQRVIELIGLARNPTAATVLAPTQNLTIRAKNGAPRIHFTDCQTEKAYAAIDRTCQIVAAIVGPERQALQRQVASFPELFE
jgi:hypothetical protein